MSQTYKNVEIVVSDDGSTDHSLEMIHEYKKKYPGIVKLISSSINRGVAQTRHEAILQAKGEYITTLDSDDYYYDEQKLEKEMELILEYKKQDKDILAFSNIVLVKGDKTLIGIQGNSKNIKEGKIFNDIITRSCMIPRDFIMKREAYFEVGGYDYHFPIYEDWDLKIRLAKKYEYYYTGINGTAYRRHGTGLSSIPISKNMKWIKKVFKKNVYLVNKTKKKDAVLKIRDFIKRMKINAKKHKLNRNQEKKQ